MKSGQHVSAEQVAHDEYYSDLASGFESIDSVEEFLRQYESNEIAPFHKGGITKGFVRGQAIQFLLSDLARKKMKTADVTVLDAGSGKGLLGIYLALKGFNVIGVDLSSVACASANQMATKLKVDGKAAFKAESLDAMTLEDGSVDYIIGHASLHHFIKYKTISDEFYRILKPGGKGFFSDSYGENLLYHIFHDREKMARLGDISLTKPLIESFFGDRYIVSQIPTDWFVMFDKLYIKLLPKNWVGFVRLLSRLHFSIDRIMPVNRFTTYLSGATVTCIEKQP